MSVKVHHPRTLEELCLRLSDGAELLGGGTILVPEWARHGPPAHAVSLDQIPLARTLTATYVGAAVTLEELCLADGPEVLQAAARSIGTTYLRGQATVGGNVGPDRPGCLLTALASLGARALVLYGTNGREANMTLDEARATGSVILGLEWQRPDASRYRKLRCGRAGLPEFAVGLAVQGRGDRRRLTAAVWRGGTVSAVSTTLAVGSPGDHAVVDALGFRPGLQRWERTVLAGELAGLSSGWRSIPLLQGASR